MESEEFTEKSTTWLNKVTKEFRGAISWLAYEEGHSGGNEEILNKIIDLVDMLEIPLREFKERLIEETINKEEYKRENNL